MRHALRTVIEVVCRILRVLIPTLVVAALPVSSRADAAEPPTPVVDGDDTATLRTCQDPLSGAEAFVSLLLDGDLADVAAGVDWTAGELADTLLTDDSLFVTDDGDVGYADEAPGPGEFTTVEPPPAHADASSVLTLHSQPAASLTIFLDFDGHVTKNTGWNAGRADEIVSTPFDRDGNPGSLSPAEIAEIEAVWRIVAEDFAPFNVDVTTEDPGTAALKFSGGGDAEYGTRIVISPTDAWFGDGYRRRRLRRVVQVEHAGVRVLRQPRQLQVGRRRVVPRVRSHARPPPRRRSTEDRTTRDTATGARSWGTATRVSSANGRRASTRAPTTPTRTTWR